MVTWLINYLMSAGAWVYPLVSLLVVLDASLFLGFLLPGEAPVIVGGVLAGRDALNLWGIGAVVALSATVGDSLSYLLGRWIGENRAVAWGHRSGITQEQMKRADKFFDRHGGKAVFAGRFASVFRPMVPFVAGATAMPYGRFLVFNAPAGLLWASLFVGLGYWAGEQWHDVAKWVDRIGWLFITMLIAFVIVRWFKNRKTRA